MAQKKGMKIFYKIFKTISQIGILKDPQKNLKKFNGT